MSYSNNDNAYLPISQLASEHNPAVLIHGNVEFACDENETDDPVSFLTPESKLVIPAWKNPSRGSIEFSFLTTEKVSVR